MESIEPKFIPLDFIEIDPDEQLERGQRFFELIGRRRTVREYSDREVPFELIERAIATAGTAPSGANLQPWRFVVVRDADREAFKGMLQLKLIWSAFAAVGLAWSTLEGDLKYPLIGWLLTATFAAFHSLWWYWLLRLKDKTES